MNSDQKLSSMLIYVFSSVLVLMASLYAFQIGRRKKNSFGRWTPSSFRAPRPPAYKDWSIETTKPLPYRPFKYGPDYFVTMGIRRMEWEDWIELDNEWTHFHKEKHRRLSEDRANNLYKITPEAKDAALETMQLLSEYLVDRYPSLYKWEWNDNQQQQQSIRILTTNEVYPIESADPLRYAALLIQDDLILMIEGPDGQYYLKGGVLLLPGFWRLQDKFGMSLAEIHTSGDVPQFREKLQSSMERYFRKMTPDQPITRYNYFIQTDGNLAWSDSIGPEDVYGIGWKNASPNPPMEQMYFRSERQTLRRLPRSGAILFTIRPYFIPVVKISEEIGIPGRLASAIRSWPDDVSDYKGKSVFKDVILPYLDDKHQQQIQNGFVETQTNSYPY